MKKLLVILIAIFILIQFIPANLPDISDNNPYDLLLSANVPADISKILKASCYDCHSNETVYPWYSYVAPVSFLVSRDTREGRKKLNFSNWRKLSKVKKAKYLDEIIDEVTEGDMPMLIYPITHPDAKLSEKDRESINIWAENYADSLFED
jgi:hypothetical protein